MRSVILCDTATDTSRVEEHRQEGTEKKYRKHINIAIGIIIAAVITTLIIFVSILASRTSYSSVSEMKSAIIGVYTCYVGEIEYQLNVTEKYVTKRCCSLGSDYDTKAAILSWNPIVGSITISTDRIYVTKSGDIKYVGQYGKASYTKGGSWSDVLVGTYSKPSSTSNSTTTDGLIYDATLVYGSGAVVVAISEDALTSFFDAINTNNDAALQELFDLGLIGETPKGTKVNILKSGISRYKVTLLDGPYAGDAVWVIREAVQVK